MVNILIIDDEKVICEIMAEIATHYGYGVAHYQTLKEGIKAAHEKPFDIVFLDNQMPDGNGLDVLSKFRSTLPYPEVIMMSGHAEPQDIEKSRKNGAWDYLQKPVSLEKFINMIQQILPHRERMSHSWLIS